MLTLTWTVRFLTSCKGADRLFVVGLRLFKRLLWSLCVSSLSFLVLSLCSCSVSHCVPKEMLKLLPGTFIFHVGSDSRCRQNMTMVKQIKLQSSFSPPAVKLLHSSSALCCKSFHCVIYQQDRFKTSKKFLVEHFRTRSSCSGSNTFTLTYIRRRMSWCETTLASSWKYLIFSVSKRSENPQHILWSSPLRPSAHQITVRT